MHPPELRAVNKDAHDQYELSMDCWRKWTTVWRSLNNTLASDCPGARADRADEVQKGAREWLASWNAAHKKTQGLYIHILVHHVPEMVRMYGDLRPFQSQGLEHAHSLRKAVGLQLTNRQEGKRTRTSMSHLISSDYCVKDQVHDQDQVDHARRAVTNGRRAVKRIEELAEKGVMKC